MFDISNEFIVFEYELKNLKFNRMLFRKIILFFKFVLNMINENDLY